MEAAERVDYSNLTLEYPKRARNASEPDLVAVQGGGRGFQETFGVYLGGCEESAKTSLLLIAAEVSTSTPRHWLFPIANGEELRTFTHLFYRTAS